MLMGAFGMGTITVDIIFCLKLGLSGGRLKLTKTKKKILQIDLNYNQAIGK